MVEVTETAEGRLWSPLLSRDPLVPEAYSFPSANSMLLFEATVMVRHTL